MIDVSYREHGATVQTCFGIRAVPVDAVQALKLARVLFPGKRCLAVVVHFDQE